MKKAALLIVLLVLCLGVSACISIDDFTGNDYSSDLPSNNRNQNHTSNNSPGNQKDPNGFSSLDALIDTYLRIQTGQSVTKKDVQRLYPQAIWDQGYTEASLDDTYAECLRNSNDRQAEYAERFGDDYAIHFSIKEAVKQEQDNTFTQEEIDESLGLFGVHPEDCFIYEVAVELTIKGSLGEKTNTTYIFVRKIGNKWYGY